jgi:hypothetical protein
MNSAVSGTRRASSSSGDSHHGPIRRHRVSTRANSRTCTASGRSSAIDRGTEAGTAASPFHESGAPPRPIWVRRWSRPSRVPYMCDKGVIIQ